MRPAPTRLVARPAFTLVELLAVIAIIAVLIGLTTAAIQKVRIRTLEVRTRHDISQIALALDAAKVKYQVDYIPSRLVFREDGRYGDYNTGSNAQKFRIRQIELDTERFLKKVWPRLVTAPPTGGASPNSRIALSNVAGAWTDWNGDGTYTQGDAGAFILEGDQVLVFLLGGMQSGGACQGFSVNKSNPTIAIGNREPILYDFPTSRLQVVAPGAFRSNQFLSFIDPYGNQPFVYFSSNSGVGYNLYNNTGPSNNMIALSDCTGLVPYFEPNGKYHNKDGFQIISAGYDKTFGLGGVFDASVGAGLTGPAVDDLTNFHPAQLGAGLT